MKSMQFRKSNLVVAGCYGIWGCLMMYVPGI